MVCKKCIDLIEGDGMSRHLFLAESPFLNEKIADYVKNLRVMQKRLNKNRCLVK